MTAAAGITLLVAGFALGVAATLKAQDIKRRLRRKVRRMLGSGR